jgi:hypothetical protein
MPWQFRKSDRNKPTFSCKYQWRAFKFSHEISVCTLQTFHRYLGLEALTAVVMKCSTFWDITPHSPLKVNQSFGGTYSLHLQSRRISQARKQRENRWKSLLSTTFTLVSCLDYSSTLKIEATYSSETSFDFQWTYIQEDRNFLPYILLKFDMKDYH